MKVAKTGGVVFYGAPKRVNNQNNLKIFAKTTLNERVVIMNISDKQYNTMVEKASHNSKLWRNVLKAFVIGGLICLVGQGLHDVFSTTDMDEKSVGTCVSVALVFFSAVLTGTGLYPKIAKHGGAGTLVPITGFANAVVSPAVEFKTEGFILGVGAKMFTIAGPVIVYGTVASVVYGLIYWITTLF